jgi:hypothetical protein
MRGRDLLPAVPLGAAAGDRYGTESDGSPGQRTQVAP